MRYFKYLNKNSKYYNKYIRILDQNVKEKNGKIYWYTNNNSSCWPINYEDIEELKYEEIATLMLIEDTAQEIIDVDNIDQLNDGKSQYGRFPRIW